MRRDRDGELVDDDVEDQDVDVDLLLHQSRCREGWLGEDVEDHPIPCALCRPHVQRDRRRTRAQLFGPWHAA